MSQLLQNHISPLDPEALAALEARGFDAEEFVQLGLSVGLEAGSRRLRGVGQGFSPRPPQLWRLLCL